MEDEKVVCTDCGKSISSEFSYSNWSGPEGEIVAKNERLCGSCFKGRKGPDIFASPMEENGW